MNDNKPEQKWQPIKTAPLNDTMVWVWHRDGGYSLAWFSRSRERWVLKDDPTYSGPNHLRLTAWHPMPEPPPAQLQ